MKAVCTNCKKPVDLDEHEYYTRYKGVGLIGVEYRHKNCTDPKFNHAEYYPPLPQGERNE